MAAKVSTSAIFNCKTVTLTSEIFCLNFLRTRGYSHKKFKKNSPTESFFKIRRKTSRFSIYEIIYWVTFDIDGVDNKTPQHLACSESLRPHAPESNIYPSSSRIKKPTMHEGLLS